MLALFIKGGPIMWPLLATSVISLGVVIERALFLLRERRRRHPEVVKRMLQEIQRGNLKGAAAIGHGSQDFLAGILVYSLEQSGGFSAAVIHASTRVLKKYVRGANILDTVITLAPLLGLLGTVTGMIHAFGLLGASELDAPAAITGGIAEALIATAFGLGIAILTLVPFNYLNSKAEEVRTEIEETASQAELLLAQPKEKLQVIRPRELIQFGPDAELFAVGGNS